ncbi:MAG: hypothetical protein ABJB74_01225 [Gemmatimonas sp.]
MKLGSSTKMRAFSLGALLVALPAISACFWNEQSTEPIKAVSFITTNPPSATMKVGGTVSFIASARDVDAQPVFNKTYAWTAADTSVVEVRPGGIFFGKKVGSTTAIVTVDGITASAPITVTP